MKKLTQRNEILAYLKAKKTLTPKQAYRLFGCMRLAAHIHVFRNRGHKILTHLTYKDGVEHANYEYLGETRGW